jgi:NDP-sugar pyrophosphorylase family protein
LERSVLDRIPPGRNVSIERETFPELIASGARLVSFVTDDYWLDIGRPQQYLQAHSDVLDRKLGLAASGESALSNRGRMWYVGAVGAPVNFRLPVFIGEDVAIDTSAIVGPYAVIGDRCSVGAGVEIRDSVLWDGVEVGAGARISDAILASDVRVGCGASVTTGAVVGHRARIAVEARLEPDARIVAGAETMAAPT